MINISMQKSQETIESYNKICRNLIEFKHQEDLNGTIQSFKTFIL